MPVDPSTLRIQLFPAEVLRVVAPAFTPDQFPSEELDRVAARMLELMRGAEGIGLAGPQVGLSWRIFVCDVPPPEEPIESTHPVSSDGPEVYLNPKIVETAGQVAPYSEGCLSLPGINGDVLRPETATIEAIGLDGSPIRKTASGLLARCWQHEIDHLDGVLILDKMTANAKSKNKTRIRQLAKAGRR